MKQFTMTFGGIVGVAVALAAITATGASAATFTSSATGTITGTQTAAHIFSPNGSSKVECKKAHLHGTIVSTSGASQHVTVTYSECTAYGFAATVSAGTFELYADGTVDIENTITVSVPAAFCKTTIFPQSGLKSASYTNASGKLEMHFALTGIVSKGEGFCPGGSNGTTAGTFLVERVGGGSLGWDA
ncbi:MAG TPA: hypothetical protein VFZ19_08035 [Solirubrobacterales bacterium]